MKTNKRNILATATVALLGMMAGTHASFAAEKDTLVMSDVNFIKKEAAAGKATVKLAELAVTKAQNADVKAFAEKLVAHHTVANEELAKLAKQKGVEVSTVIDPDHAETYQKLEKYSGAEFDKEFLSTVVSGHKKCVDSFEEEVKDAKDADVKAWSEKTLATLKTHLDKANELSSK